MSPQRVTHYRESWYLDAWDEGKAAWRCFAIDRILRATPLDPTAIDVANVELDLNNASAVSRCDAVVAPDCVQFGWVIKYPPIDADRSNGMFIMCCSPGSNCFEWVKTIAPVIVTVIFGAIAGALTWRQYQVAHAKLKLDLFERRYAIFMKVWEITSQIAIHGHSLDKHGGLCGFGTPFNNIKPEAAFLFGKRIDDYITELATKWIQYRAHQELREDDARKNADDGRSFQNYFFEQANSGVTNRFAPFLNFEKWK